MELVLKFAVAVGMSEYWSSVIQNAIGCGLGSIAAIAISIWLYQLSNKHNNTILKNEKKSNEDNQLKAFKKMLESVLKISDKMLEATGDFIVALKKHPVKFPLFAMTSFQSLKRVSDTITIEKTGMTYIKYFPEEKSLNEFISILDVVDYLYAEFGGMHKLLERATNHHTERLLKVNQAFLDADKMLINARLDTTGWPGKNIAEIKYSFVKNRTNIYDIDELYELYLKPMETFLKETMNKGVINDFIVNYCYEVSNAVDNYAAIAVGIDDFVLTMGRIEGSVKENLAKLRNFAEKILKTQI